jgi:hypothetical protein
MNSSRGNFNRTYYFIGYLNNPYEKCETLSEYELGYKNFIAGSLFFLIALASLIANGLLLCILAYNWREHFRRDFVYKLIVVMCGFSLLSGLFYMAMMVPCTYSGCPFYNASMRMFFTTFMISFEYGFYFSVFFIAIDRFLAFYWINFSGYFRQVCVFLSREGQDLSIFKVIQFAQHSIQSIGNCLACTYPSNKIQLAHRAESELGKFIHEKNL